MKRLIATLALVLWLTACGKTDAPVTDAGSTPGTDSTAPPGKDVVAPPHTGAKSASMFDEATIPAFALTFAPSDWTALTTTWKDPKWKNPASPATWEVEKKTHWVHCTFSYDSEKAPDSACRLRGNPTDWSYEKKPQIHVKFNNYNKDTRFRGLRSLSLEFFSVHAAPLRDQLGMTLMREAGLPAARVSHIRLTIDGKDYGLYMALEPVDREFLEEHFVDPKGNLYEGGYLKQTNNSDPDMSDMDAVNELIDGEPQGVNHASFASELSSLVDIPQVLRELAAESVLPTNDNLSNGSTNFYFYHPPNGLFVAIPWDLDDILSPKNSPASSPLYTYLGYSDTPSKLMALVSEWPAWKTEVEDDVVELRDGPHAALKARAAELCAMLRPEYDKDAFWKMDFTLADFDKDCEAIGKHIDDRSAFLKTSLGR